VTRFASRLGQRALVPLGLFVVVGFFLPWLAPTAPRGMDVGLFGAGWSGWTFATEDREHMLLLVPLCGLALAACGAMKRPPNAVIAALGGAIAAITVWVFVRPLFPSSSAFVVTIAGVILAIVGSFTDRRALRALGGIAIAGSFGLSWLGSSGFYLVEHRPPSCGGRISIIPYGVLVAGALALVSAALPRAAARYVAWAGALLAIATVVAYATVYSWIGLAVWCTLGIAAYTIALGLASASRSNAAG
jgi:hypothetical protein